MAIEMLDDEDTGGRKDARTTRSGRQTRDTVASRSSISEDKLAKARASFSAQWNASALPSVVQDDPDWHYCWLSTTNSYDPIEQRVSLGYEPVRPEDAPNMRGGSAMKSGEFAGCVSHKEMVLFRIPREIYQVAMEEMHFHAPNAQEDALKAMFDELKHGDTRGLTRSVGDDANSFEAGKRAPIFD